MGVKDFKTAYSYFYEIIYGNALPFCKLSNFARSRRTSFRSNSFSRANSDSIFFGDFIGDCGDCGFIGDFIGESGVFWTISGTTVVSINEVFKVFNC
jgi:hypothetical protein